LRLQLTSESLKEDACVMTALAQSCIKKRTGKKRKDMPLRRRGRKKTKCTIQKTRMYFRKRLRRRSPPTNKQVGKTGSKKDRYATAPAQLQRSKDTGKKQGRCFRDDCAGAVNLPKTKKGWKNGEQEGLVRHCAGAVADKRWSRLRRRSHTSDTQRTAEKTNSKNDWNATAPAQLQTSDGVDCAGAVTQKLPKE